MTRREALERVALFVGGAFAVPVAAGMLAGCRPTPSSTSFVPEAMTPDEFDLIGALVDIIIPATDTPGAREAGVPTFIDGLLAGWFTDEDKQVFTEGMAALETYAQAQFGSAATALTPEQQLEVVTDLDAQVYGGMPSGDTPDALRTFYQGLKGMTLLGYYTSEVGATQELKLNPMGTFLGDIPYADIGHAWA